jgi:hypothetical protein
MAQHDFSELFSQYPAVISVMPGSFTSHEFILELARRNQSLYIEALFSYRHRMYRNAPAPFMMVHGILAQHLLNYPELLTQIHKGVPSKDIFGQPNASAAWKKVC